MKKVLLISLIGPGLLVILRVVDVIKNINILGFGNNYYCNLSTDAKCSLSYYIFKSDEAVISYIGIIVSFLLLFIITSYILFLIKLYKNTKRVLFWILIALTVIVLIVSPFVVNYIQIIS